MDDDIEMEGGQFFYTQDPWGRSYLRPKCDVGAQWVNPHETKSKSAWPYAYSEFFHFGDRDIIEEKGVHGDYSDHLYDWWCDKKSDAAYSALWKKHVGTRWEYAKARQLTAFLNEYNAILWPDKPRKVQVVAMAEGCDIATGFPYWIVWTKEVA